MLAAHIQKVMRKARHAAGFERQDPFSGSHSETTPNDQGAIKLSKAVRGPSSIQPVAETGMDLWIRAIKVSTFGSNSDQAPDRLGPAAARPVAPRRSASQGARFVPRTTPL
jgi:hypothetical protein